MAMGFGKDSRTQPATLDPGKTHDLAVAALHRQQCRRLHGQIMRTNIYAISIRSIPTATYLSSLTSLFFLRVVFSVSFLLVFPLPPSVSYRREHETGCDRIVYGNFTHRVDVLYMRRLTLICPKISSELKT